MIKVDDFFRRKTHKKRRGRGDPRLYQEGSQDLKIFYEAW